MRPRAALAAWLAFLLVQPCGADENQLGDIRLPRGFSIDIYADVPTARSLALGENGTVFVSNRRGSSIYAIISNNDER